MADRTIFRGLSGEGFVLTVELFANDELNVDAILDHCARYPAPGEAREPGDEDDARQLPLAADWARGGQE